MNESLTEKTRVLHTWLKESDTIAIVSQNGPDGDAAGCVTAFRNFVTGVIGNKAGILLPSPAPDYLSFITNGENILFPDSGDPDDFLECADLLVCLDFNTMSRTDTLEKRLTELNVRKVLIDHHPGPDETQFDLVFSSTEVSSACEMLYNILMAMPEIAGDASKLPAKTAIALMTGMTTDTNNFANSVFPGTLAMASELLAAGVDRDEIIEHLYHEYRPNRIALCSHMLCNELHTVPGGGAYMIVRRKTWEQFGAIEGETEGLVNTPLSIKDIRLSLLLREDDGFFRVSVRSKEGVSANTMARECFHGGGHERAAGGRVFFPGDIESPDEIETYVIETTARFLQNIGPAKN